MKQEGEIKPLLRRPRRLLPDPSGHLLEIITKLTADGKMVSDNASWRAAIYNQHTTSYRVPHGKIRRCANTRTAARARRLVPNN